MSTGCDNSQEEMLPLLHSSNSTQGSSQGFLWQEAGIKWRFLLPGTMQQENTRSKVFKWRAGSAAACCGCTEHGPPVPPVPGICLDAGCRARQAVAHSHRECPGWPCTAAAPAVLPAAGNAGYILPRLGRQGQGLGNSQPGPCAQGPAALNVPLALAHPWPPGRAGLESCPAEPSLPLPRAVWVFLLPYLQ